MDRDETAEPVDRTFCRSKLGTAGLLRRHRSAIVPYLFLFVLSVTLRLLLLDLPVWTDERITLHFLRTFGTIELIWIIPVRQPHFPLYYVFADPIVSLFGPQSLRWISVAAGSLLPVVAYHWFRQLLDERRAQVVGLSLAVSPLLVTQAYWMRMYALLALAVLVAYWTGWRWLHDEVRTWQLGVASALVVALHPYGIVATASLLGWLALERWQTGWRPSLKTSGAVIAGLALPVGYLSAKIIGIRGVGIVNKLHMSPSEIPLIRMLVLPLTTLMGTLYSPLHVVLAALVSLWIAISAYRQRLWKSRVGRLSMCWVLGPLALLLAAQLVFPLLQMKYLAWVAPGVALTIAQVTPSTRRPYLLTGLLAGLLLAGLFLRFEEAKLVSRVAIYQSGVI